jgi:hypothetical protein
MDIITPNQYIRLNKKICNLDIIITANKLASEWGITPVEACYRVLTESLMRESNKRKSDAKKNIDFN